MSANDNQKALAANLNNVANAILKVQEACQGYRNFAAHFPAASLPSISASVESIESECDALLVQVQHDMAVATEVAGLE